MIRRHVLAALAAGIAAGDDDAARAYLKTVDYVLRGATKRRMESALIDAALATNELGGAVDPESARHVQRVAALLVAGVTSNVQDRAAVNAAYAALPPVRGRGAPIATMIVSIVLLAGIGSGVAAYVLRPPPASRRYVRPLPPPAAGAFKDGGVPLPDPAIAAFLEKELTAFIIETDRDRNTGGTNKERAARAQQLMAPSVITAKGPALAKAWADMIGMLDKWVHVPSSSMEFETIARDLRHRVRDVSEQFAAAGIGYYLEGDIREGTSGAHALIYAYRVEEVVFVIAQRTTGKDRRRILSLRRVDHLNLTHTLLGMQSAELGDPVLLLDQIDSHVSRVVLPVLAKGARYNLGDEAWNKTPEGAEVSALVGVVIRDEMTTALGPDASAASEVAALLVERAALVEQWAEVMQRRGWIIRGADELFLPPQLLAQLEGLVPRATLDRGAAIEERLAVLEAPRIASLVHQLVAASVRRHEAQHGMDEDRAEPLRYPAPLSQLIGPADENGNPRRRVELARLELAAYLAQVANDPVTPQLSLFNVVSHGANDNMTNTPESYAGVLIAEGLGRALKLPSPGPVIHERRIDRQRLAVLARALTAVSGERLRTAARTLWLELYGEPIIAIVDR